MARCAAGGKSLLIGCAAAENRTIFKKLSEEETMLNETLPVEERAESFSPAGMLAGMTARRFLCKMTPRACIRSTLGSPVSREMALYCVEYVPKREAMRN